MADWLVDELEPLASDVTRQMVTVPIPGDTLVGTNIIASFNLDPQENMRIMLSTHWDTRPWADNEQDPDAHDQPILGANDGGSGVAVLLAIAEILHENPLDFGIDLLFFDLEDSGRDSTVAFALGSEFFAEHRPAYRPNFGINIDMVCDSTLQILKEMNSAQGARLIVEQIWRAAEQQNADVFVQQVGPPVFDDHVPFLRRGIRVVNLIHSPFPSSWHTMDDTLDRCSASNLAQVANTVLSVVYAQ